MKLTSTPIVSLLAVAAASVNAQIVWFGPPNYYYYYHSTELVRLYHAGLTDDWYGVDPAEIAAKQANGYDWYGNPNPGRLVTAASITAGAAVGLPDPAAVPLRRFWNSAIVDHWYSTTTGAVPSGYVEETSPGLCWPTQVEGTIPLYGYYQKSDIPNTNVWTTNHVITTSYSEYRHYVLYGSTDLGVVCYVYPLGAWTGSCQPDPGKEQCYADFNSYGYNMCIVGLLAVC